VLAVAATGTLKETNSAANVPATNWVTIGTNTYTFFKKITNSTPRQVAIAGTFDSTMNTSDRGHQSRAVPAPATAPARRPNPQVTAGSLVNHAFTVRRRPPVYLEIRSGSPPVSRRIELEWRRPFRRGYWRCGNHERFND